jgi:hypothetical protein
MPHRNSPPDKLTFLTSKKTTRKATSSPLYKLSTKRNWARLQLVGSRGQILKTIKTLSLDGLSLDQSTKLIFMTNALILKLLEILDQQWERDRERIKNGTGEITSTGKVITKETEAFFTRTY